MCVKFKYLLERMLLWCTSPSQLWLRWQHIWPGGSWKSVNSIGDMNLRETWQHLMKNYFWPSTSVFLLQCSYVALHGNVCKKSVSTCIWNPYWVILCFSFLPACKEARFFVRSIEHLQHIGNAHVQHGKWAGVKNALIQKARILTFLSSYVFIRWSYHTHTHTHARTHTHTQSTGLLPCLEKCWPAKRAGLQ